MPDVSPIVSLDQSSPESKERNDKSEGVGSPKARVPRRKAVRDALRLRRKSTRFIDEFAILSKEERLHLAARYF